MNDTRSDAQSAKESVRNRTFHGGDELFGPVVVGGQDFVKPPQFGVAAVVLSVQKQTFYTNVVLRIFLLRQRGAKEDKDSKLWPK